MPRAGLTDIITHVRSLIGDPNGDNFSDDEIQNALDKHRWEARYLPLTAIRSIASGGVSTYVIFCSEKPWQYWETDAVLTNGNYDDVTGDAPTPDLFAGRWTFSSEPDRPIRITGFSHDPYGAAADLMENRSGQLAEDVETFQTVNGSFSFSGKRKGPSETAAKYRVMARSSTSTAMMVRTDVNLRG